MNTPTQDADAAMLEFAREYTRKQKEAVRAYASWLQSSDKLALAVAQDMAERPAEWSQAIRAALEGDSFCLGALATAATYNYASERV